MGSCKKGPHSFPLTLELWPAQILEGLLMS